MDAVLSVSVAVYSTGNFKKDFGNKCVAQIFEEGKKVFEILH